MLLFLALAGTCAYLYASVRRTTEVLNLIYDNQPSTRPGPDQISWDEAVERLGGEERAAARLAFYLDLPVRLAPEKWRATDLLYRCGDPSVDVFLRLLEDRDPIVRSRAGSALIMSIDWSRPDIPLAIIRRRGDEAISLWAEGLLTESGDNPKAAPVLIEALGLPDARTRRLAAAGLGGMKSSADTVIPALEKALSDADEEVRAEAREALEKIRSSPGYRDPEDNPTF